MLREEAEELLGKHFASFGDQDLVGMSGLITTLKWQVDVSSMVRSLQPDTLLVSGGGLATEFRQVLFEWMPEIDGIAHSEGDDVILKMAHDARVIRNLGMKRAINSNKLAPYLIGEVNKRARFSYDGGRPKDLDCLPMPAWDLLEKDVYGFPVLETYIRNPIWGAGAQNSSSAPFTIERSLSMVSSRGCPFACKFCFRGAQGERNYGIRSPASILKEIEYAVDSYNIDFMGILDDNFMVQPGRIAALPEVFQPILRERGVHWGTHGRLDEAADLRPTQNGGQVKDSKIIRVDKMAEAGCVYIGFGAESACEKTLESMGKGGFILKNGMQEIDGFRFPVTMVEGVKRTRSAGINGNLTWIMGYPGETLDDLKVTVAFMLWQEDYYRTRGASPSARSPGAALAAETDEEIINRSLFVATAYPGTEMFKHPDVRATMARTFDVKFDRETNEPIPDDNFFNYVSELDDATKTLEGVGGLMNFSKMTDDEFLEVRNFVDTGEIEKILEL